MVAATVASRARGDEKERGVHVLIELLETRLVIEHPALDLGVRRR